jgi:CDP-diacylglycerol--glycerol-3-phosphate 3-phosphatidyltransferase
LIDRHIAVDDGSNRQRLKKAWWTAFLFCLLFILLCFSGLSLSWQLTEALKWLLQTAAVNAYVLWLLWQALKKNDHPAAYSGRPDLGAANWLTLLRGFLIGTLAGFLFPAASISADRFSLLAWTPGAVYLVAAVLDYFDGYVARITKHESRLGEWLDTQIDAVGLLIAPALAIEYGRLPIFYISVGLAYYVFQFGIWYRKKRGWPVIKVLPHPAKRMLAGFQMGLVAFALLPLFSRPVLTLAAFIFMVPLLAGFIRDWLVVCGSVEIDQRQQTRWDRPIALLLTRLLPVLLRFVMGVAGIFFFYDAVTVLSAGAEIVPGKRPYFTEYFDPPALLLMATAALMIASGIITRIAALFICIFLTGALTSWDSPPGLFFLFSCAAILMLTGSGLLSTWHPEDSLLLKRQG